ncbi:MAG: hypothetical protein ACE3L7_09730 [Candidatus Pristimantibacillus sp.]
MSACLVIQTGKAMLTGSGTAISSTINDQIYRLDESGVKLWHVDNMVIFCSGNMDYAYETMNHFVMLSNRNYEPTVSLKGSLFEQHINSTRGISVVHEDVSYLYHISPANNFIIETRKMESNADAVAIWSAGIKTAESADKAECYLVQGQTVNEVYQNVFDYISFESVGGELAVFQMIRDEVNCMTNEDLG